MNGPAPPLRIVVVGGGASGTIMVANLARRAGSRPLEVTLIDRTGIFGPGVPYLTTNPDHKLNVAAARMSADDDDPGHFLNWLKGRDPEADGFDFVSRGTYGRYLEDVLAEAEGSLPPGMTLRKVTAEVTGITVGDSGASVAFASDPEPSFESDPRPLADGARIECDHVVLCSGPLPGGDPIDIPDILRENGTYIANAWDEVAIDPARKDDQVLVIGAGLTMVDAAISLAGEPGGPVVRAISRNGLVPKAHRRGFTTVEDFPLPAEGPIPFEDAFQIYLSQRRRLEEAGGDWRDAMDSMRPNFPAMWRRVPLEDKRWALGKFQRIWEVHRFRMAPEVAGLFDGLAKEGQIQVSAGRVTSITPTHSDGNGSGTPVPDDEDSIISSPSSGATVELETAEGTETLEVGHIINSTGASGNVLKSAPPLVTSLIESGAARPDDLLFGLDVTPDGRAIDSEGNPSDQISLIGSIRRGAEWEAIGVTEIRRHAKEIANRLL